MLSHTYSIGFPPLVSVINCYKCVQHAIQCEVQQLLDVNFYLVFFLLISFTFLFQKIHQEFPYIFIRKCTFSIFKNVMSCISHHLPADYGCGCMWLHFSRDSIVRLFLACTRWPQCSSTSLGSRAPLVRPAWNTTGPSFNRPRATMLWESTGYINTQMLTQLLIYRIRQVGVRRHAYAYAFLFCFCFFFAAEAIVQIHVD